MMKSIADRRRVIENGYYHLKKLASVINDLNLGDLAEIQELIVEAEELLNRLNKIESGEMPAVLGVVGAFSSGKSSFINRILGEHICPVDVCPTTSSITHFKYGSSKNIVKSTLNDNGSRVEEDISHDIYTNLVKHNNTGRDGKTSPISFDYYAPFDIFRTINLIDTPGFENSANPHDQEITLAKMHESDVLFYLMDIGQGEITSSGLTNLEEIRCKSAETPVYLVLNKADTKKPSSREKILNKAKEKYSKLFRRCFLFCSKPETDIPLTTSVQDIRKILQEISNDKTHILSGRQSYLESFHVLKVNEKLRGIIRILQLDVDVIVNRIRDCQDVEAELDTWHQNTKKRIREFVCDLVYRVALLALNVVEIEDSGFFYNNARIIINRSKAINAYNRTLTACSYDSRHGLDLIAFLPKKARQFLDEDTLNSMNAIPDIWKPDNENNVLFDSFYRSLCKHVSNAFEVVYSSRKEAELKLFTFCESFEVRRSASQINRYTIRIEDDTEKPIMRCLDELRDKCLKKIRSYKEQEKIKKKSASELLDELLKNKEQLSS